MADQSVSEIELELAHDEWRDQLKFVIENMKFHYQGAYVVEPGVMKDDTWFNEIKAAGRLASYTNPYEGITEKQPDLLQRKLTYGYYADWFDHSAQEIRSAVDITPALAEVFMKRTDYEMKIQFIAALTAACGVKSGGSESSETFDTNSVASNGQVFDISTAAYAGRWDYAKLCNIMTQLGEAGWLATNDELFFAISYRDYADIKNIAEFNSAQLLTSTSESMGFRDAFRWEGATWLVDNQADLGVSSTTQYNYCWLKSAMRGCMPQNPDVRIFDRSADTKSNQVYRSKLNVDFGFARACSSASSNNLTRGVARIENDFS